MTTYTSAQQAAKLWKEHFPESSVSNSTYSSKINSIRSNALAGTSQTYLQRVANQIIFLTTLYDKRTAAGLTATEIAELKSSLWQTTFETLEKLKYMDGNIWNERPFGADVGEGIALSALIHVMKGEWYNTLNVSGRTRISDMMNKAAQRALTFVNGNYQVKVIAEGKPAEVFVSDGATIKVAPAGIAAVPLLIGALGLYSGLMTTHTSPNQYSVYPKMKGYGDNINSKYLNWDGVRAHAAVGISGGTRAFFPNSAYMPLLGVGLAWLNYGVSYPTVKALGNMPVDSTYTGYTAALGKYYKDVLAKTGHAPYFGYPGLYYTSPNFGKFPTEQNQKDAAKKEFVDYKANINGTVKSTFPNDTNLTLAPADHENMQTGYVYPLVWGGDSTFIPAVDKALRNSPRASEKVIPASGESVIVAYAKKGDAASHRSFLALAGAMIKGITVTDGL